MTAASVPGRSFIALRLARILALLFMLFCLGLFAAGIYAYPQYASLHQEQFTTYSWSLQDMEHVLSKAGLSMHWWILVNLLSAILIGLIFSGTGLLIFIRKKEDWFGVYVAVAFVLYGTQASYSTIALLTVPALQPVLMVLGVSAWASFFLLTYLFPNGRFAPPWTRWAALLLILLFIIDIVFYKGNQPPTPYVFALMLLVITGIGSQVYRYRKVSTALERQQTKWVLFALIVMCIVLVCSLAPLIFPQWMDPNSQAALFLVFLSSSSTFFITLFPISVAFAILRYRLWDVDLLIRKTLVYGALTLTLAAVYFGGVLLLQRIFQAISGLSQSPVAIVISTLLIAALFNPLHGRIQNDIDKRFYRRKYDAQKALERLAVTARTEVELEHLTGQLLAVVDETLQPQKISLWLPASAFEKTTKRKNSL